MSSSPSLISHSDTSYTLPPEVLRTIFLLVDPHTLYTSIRTLSKQWRETVEDHLLSHQFNSNNWRIALRVSRRFKLNPITSSINNNNDNNNHYNNPINSLDNLDRDERLKKILSMEGLREDQLDQLNESAQQEEDHLNNSNDSNLSSNSNSSAFSSKVKSHVIPLKFEKYDSETTSLAFSTGKEWHALFEQPVNDEEDNHDNNNNDHNQQENRRSRNDPQDARLDLDFAIVWRFPGDGKDQDDEDDEDNLLKGNPSKAKNKSKNSIKNRERAIAEKWGNPDPENNWLSRFHCSGYDVSPVVTNPSSRLPSPTSSGISTPSRKLLSTPLARRTRTKPDSNPSTSSQIPRIQRTAVLRRAERNPESNPNHYDDEDVGDDCDCDCDGQNQENQIDEEDEMHGVNDLIWSDKGHEYINLNLNLGIEFFVRRSAKANLLHRKLEEEAMRRFQEDQEEEEGKQSEKISFALSSSSSSEYEESSGEDINGNNGNQDLASEKKVGPSSSSTTSTTTTNPSNVNANMAWDKPWIKNQELKSNSNNKNMNLNPDPFAHLPFIHRPKAQKPLNKKFDNKSSSTSTLNSPRNSSPLSPLSRSNSHQRNLSNLNEASVSSPPPSRMSHHVSRISTPINDNDNNDDGSKDQKHHHLESSTSSSKLFGKEKFLNDLSKVKGIGNNDGEEKLIATSLPVTPSFRSSKKNSKPSKIQDNLIRTTEALMLSNSNSTRPSINFPTPGQSNFAAKRLAHSQSQSLNPTRPSSRAGFSRFNNGTGNTVDQLDLDRITRSTSGTPRARFVGRLYRAEDLLSPQPRSNSSPNSNPKTKLNSSSSLNPGCVTPNKESDDINRNGTGKCEKCLAKRREENMNIQKQIGSSFPNGGAWNPDPEELKTKPDKKGWIGGDSLGRGQVRMAFDEDLPITVNQGKEDQNEGINSKAFVWEWSR